MTEPTDMRGKQYGSMTGDMGKGGDVLLDITRAILMDGVKVAAVDTYSNVIDQVARGASHEVRLSLEIEGRVNKSDERAKAMFLFDADGAAAIVTELIGIATRIGPEFSKHFMARMEAMDDSE